MVSDAPGIPGRVLFVGHDNHLGGAQLALRDTVAALEGSDRHVVLPQGDGPLEEQLTAAGATVHRLPVGLWGRAPYGAVRNRARVLIGGVGSAGGLVALLRSLRPDLVITNTGLPTAGAAAARVLGLPHAWWLHERQRREAALDFAFSLERMRAFMSGSGHVIVPSAFLAQECATWVPAVRLHVVQPTVAPVVPAPHVVPAASIRRVVFPGGLQEVKRPMDALDAVLRVREGHPDVSLDIVGYDGPLRAAVEARVDAARAGSSVRIRGFLSDWSELLQPGSVVVSCGLSETFGRVLVEAMSAGVPVVAADAGASPEIITSGHNGLLYRPGDPVDLAHSLRSLMENPGRAQRLASQALRDAATRWTAEAHAESLAQVWPAIKGSAR